MKTLKILSWKFGRDWTGLFPLRCNFLGQTICSAFFHISPQSSSSLKPFVVWRDSKYQNRCAMCNLSNFDTLHNLHTLHNFPLLTISTLFTISTILTLPWDLKSSLDLKKLLDLKDLGSQKPSQASLTVRFLSYKVEKGLRAVYTQLYF